MAIVNNGNGEERAKALHTLDDLMTCEALRHGIFNDQNALPRLIQFYNEIFMRAPADRRRQIYRYVTMIVPQLGGWTAGAFTPFILLDTDTGIVSTATVELSLRDCTRSINSLRAAMTAKKEHPASIM